MKSLRLLACSIVLATVLYWLLLLVFAADNSSVNATSPDLLQTAQPLQTGRDDGPQLSVMLQTESGPSDAVFLGEKITYTIYVTNVATVPITLLEIIDILPAKVFLTSTLRCRDCNISAEPLANFVSNTTDVSASVSTSTVNQVAPSVPISTPLPTSTPIKTPGQPPGNTQTRFASQLTWSGASLPVGQSTFYTFTGIIRNQLDGSILQNRAIATYKYHEEVQQVLLDVATTVRVPPGSNLYNQEPIWQANLKGGGLYSADWGDFDRDGDLDLAVAVAGTGFPEGNDGGTYVFQNNHGQFQQIWHDNRFVRGVRWGDFVVSPNRKENYLELVSVGHNNANGFVNYVFKYLPLSQRFAEFSQFITDGLLFQVEPIQAANGDSIDLIGDAFQNNCQIIRLQKTDGTFSRPTQNCINGVWPLGLGDVDNDGKADLAIDNFRSRVEIFKNNNGMTAPIAITTTPSVPYDYLWGDFFNKDGSLDLAALFHGPSRNEIRIYPNEAGNITKSPAVTLTLDYTFVRGLDAGDLNNDGFLDLIVGDPPAKVFTNTQFLTKPFETTSASTLNIAESLNGTQIVRTIDIDNDGDLDLFVASLDGRVAVFSNPSTPLARTITSIERSFTPAASLAWGDANGDGYLDLLLGAGSVTQGAPNSIDAKLYFNFAGNLQPPENPLEAPLSGSGIGPQQVAWADVFSEKSRSESRLEAAIGGVNTPLRVYKDLGRLATERIPLQQLIAFPTDANDLITGTTALAWGDINGDGALDLAVGEEQGDVLLFQSKGNQLNRQPMTISQSLAAVSALAWADFNADHYMDLAVGREKYPPQLYQNLGDNTFQLLEPFTAISGTRSLAWADFDQDGDLDLTVGNYSGTDIIYVNDNFTFREDNKKNVTLKSTRTTSLDWGDVDGDGDLDLAVGKDQNHVLVYVNEDSSLIPLWSSTESFKTTDVEWGDIDNDGDLDLAISQGEKAPNGYYQNFYVSPSHLSEDFVRTLPLSNQPSYLSIAGLGKTPKANNYFSPQILSGPQTPTQTRPVTISYNLYDPDGSRQLGSEPNPKLTIFTSTFEYSLDGGGVWQKATPAKTNPPVQLFTTRLGQSAQFLWDAVADKAISDDTRFRIKIIHDNPLGPVQRASTAAISPPFRVRGTTCLWPIDPTIHINEPQSAPPHNGRYTSLNELDLTGSIQQGSGVITYIWRVFDSKNELVKKEGQRVIFTQATVEDPPIVLEPEKFYTVTLQVQGPKCPETRVVSTTLQIQGPLGTYLPFIANQTPTWSLYMPLISNIFTQPISAQANNPPSIVANKSYSVTKTLRQVSGLFGSEHLDQNIVTLQWDPLSDQHYVDGYHIYRLNRGIPGEQFVQIGSVGVNIKTYSDPKAICNGLYYVTAFNADGESLPSTTSYYTMPCR